MIIEADNNQQLKKQLLKQAEEAVLGKDLESTGALKIKARSHGKCATNISNNTDTDIFLLFALLNCYSFFSASDRKLIHKLV